MYSTGFSGIAVPRFGLSLLFAEPIHSSSNRLTAFHQEDLHRIPPGGDCHDREGMDAALEPQTSDETTCKRSPDQHKAVGESQTALFPAR